jgi:hypothetical protein
VLNKLYCAAMMIMVLSGCSEATDNDVQAKASLKRLTMPCGAMTRAAAAQILAVAEDEVEYSYSEQLKTCSYRAGLAKSVSYTVYAEPDAATAKSEMAKVAEGLKFLVECETVDGYGDEAVYCNGDRAERMLVRKGGDWIDIIGPSGREPMANVAVQVFQ